jgi:hypothetical protein
MMLNQKNNRPLEPTLIPQDTIEPQSDASISVIRQRGRRLTMHEKFWLNLNTVGHLPLSNLDDRNSPLSQFQYFLRSSCLSLHFATPVDINEGSGTSVKPPTQIGQVGFKCRFCKDKDSYYWRTFPASIKDIPHDMLALADKHLKTCKHMFPQHRRIFDHLYSQPGATVITPERYEFWCSNANTVFKMYNSVGGGFMFCPPEVHSMTECRVVREAHILDDN